MTTQAWIIIAAVAAVLLVVLVAGFLRYRKGQVSLKAPETKPELGAPEKDKSGGYKAGGGFNFSQGSTATAPPPVVPTPPVAEMPPVVEEPVVEKPIVEEPVAEKPAVVEEPVVEEPAVVEEPVVEEPVIEKPVVEEPAVAEPVVEEPVVPEPVVVPAPVEPAPRVLDEIDPTEGRLDRLRGRLSRSQSAVGKSLLGLLGGGDLDEDSWEEVEDTLLIADLGSATTEKSSRSFVSRWRSAASGPRLPPAPFCARC